MTPSPITPEQARDYRGRVVVVIAARNEGQNVVDTIRAFRANKARDTSLFFSVVDDGSDDGCCSTLSRAADVSCVRNPAQCSQAAAFNLGALRFINERPDAIVFMDAHMQPAGNRDIERLNAPEGAHEHVLEKLALAAARTGSVVCPLCTSLEKDKQWLGAGGRLRWWPHPCDEAKSGPGLRVQWAYDRSTEYVSVGTVYGGCYAMTPDAYLTLGGFMDSVGLYGYREEALGCVAFFHEMPLWCYTRAMVKHLFRAQRPYPMASCWRWRNYTFGNKVIWTDDTFRRFFLPVAELYGSDPMVAYYADAPWIGDLRDAFQRRKSADPKWSEHAALRWLGIISDTEAES